MCTKNPVAFSEKVNRFVDDIMKHTDVISVETVGNVTTITYEDWTEHPPIKNTPREATMPNPKGGGMKGMRRPLTEQTRENLRLGQQKRKDWSRNVPKTYKKKQKDEEE